jgi:hypothetical protein
VVRGGEIVARSEGDILLGSWLFEVFQDEYGDPYTEYSVIDPHEEYVAGDVNGDLASAVQAAYDAKGIVCPLVRDADLDALK